MSNQKEKKSHVYVTDKKNRKILIPVAWLDKFVQKGYKKGDKNG